jgi:hypothetical protein
MTISVGCRHMTNVAVVAVLLATFAGAQQSPQSSDAKAEAQAQPNVVRIGVPVMENTSTRSVNRKLQRDWLVRAFQPDKNKKKKGKQPEPQRIDAVALDSDSPAEAAREARDKNCSYVLYTKLVELREPGDPQRRNQPGSVTIGRDPLSVYPDPTIMHDPVHYAVVEYRLQRVGDSKAQLALSVSGEEHADENGTVQSLLFLIVNRVKDELREPSGTSPE